MAEILQFLGQREHAVESYRRQADLLKSLLAEAPTNVSYRRELATSHRLRGFVLREMKRTVQAREADDQATRICEQLLRESPDDPVAHVELANILLNTAVLLSGKDHADEPERLHDRTMELYRAAATGRARRSSSPSAEALISFSPEP